MKVRFHVPSKRDLAAAGTTALKRIAAAKARIALPKVALPGRLMTLLSSPE
jgi:hypothetical protein